ncbi:MAG: hypothetical protein LC541_15945 [Candidatus Thiodiazotropha sp.]|nr:hypothetical protein [Candidatus Thiodiazotropha sp.]MCM8884765.1 hypothetical protein [Candidatus Thiodiazotropha sp.]
MTGRRVRMLALHPLWRKARRVYSLASRLPGTNRLGFQPSLALSDCVYCMRCRKRRQPTEEHKPHETPAQ